MIPSVTRPTDHLQVRFLEVLPRIERYARFHFHAVRCAVRKSDFIAEAVAVCWRWFVRLDERGKDGAAFVSAMASLAARHVKAGRGLCGQERGRDVLSFTAQRRHGFRVEALPMTTRRFEEANDGGLVEHEYDVFEDRLRDNTHTPVPDQAAFRIDWPAFLGTLSGRDRRLAGYLSAGHSAKAAAAKFGLTPGRVTQLRQQWCRDWRVLEDPDASERRCRLNRAPLNLDAAVA